MTHTDCWYSLVYLIGKLQCLVTAAWQDSKLLQVNTQQKHAFLKERHKFYRERKQLLPEQLIQQEKTDWLSDAEAPEICSSNEVLPKIPHFEMFFKPTWKPKPVCCHLPHMNNHCLGAKETEVLNPHDTAQSRTPRWAVPEEDTSGPCAAQPCVTSPHSSDLLITSIAFFTFWCLTVLFSSASSYSVPVYIYSLLWGWFTLKPQC